ncbi:Sulfatase [Penicillium diatomitis]|uniref:Sulfatase n=1 Tax=Penicillium diatomitis TaxID=2819901 RepID=A0A9W9XJH8_9EURO|nr:Sulfatase [Penicillium diatomitis]KAJ5493504.1 Sulfatase [Penicillium diatomitis]
MENYHSPHVNDFNSSDFLLDPCTYSYLISTYQRYQEDPVSYEDRHRLPRGKACGFEEDIRVPLIVRGPGVPAGK